jgi:hypothetical protein
LTEKTCFLVGGYAWDWQNVFIKDVLSFPLFCDKLKLKCKIVWSRLSLHSCLIFNEFPEMTIVFDTNYQLQYSQSYTGRVHDDCSFEDVPQL